jgi:hypothetical protein
VSLTSTPGPVSHYIFPTNFDQQGWIFSESPWKGHSIRYPFLFLFACLVIFRKSSRWHASGKYVEELSITWDLFAGKTALRQSSLQSNALNHLGHVACMPLFSLSTSRAQDRNKCILFHRNQDERTRGTEISLVKDSDIAMSIWDLAGQEEYHAFHDYMMPNFGDVVSPCSFLFLFDPRREMHVGEKNQSRKEPKVLKEELIYWLQFIASNTPTSIAFPPQLTVILTHADKDLHGGLAEWAEQVVQNQRTTFKDIVNISPNIYALNARSTNDVRPVLDFVFENSQQLLKRMLSVQSCAVHLPIEL